MNRDGCIEPRLVSRYPRCRDDHTRSDRRIQANRCGASRIRRGPEQAVQQATGRPSRLCPARGFNSAGLDGGAGSRERAAAGGGHERRALPRGIRLRSRRPRDPRCLADEADLLRRGTRRRRGRGRRDGRRDVPGAVRGVGHRDPARRVSGNRHGRSRGGRRVRLPVPAARSRGGLPVCHRSGDRRRSGARGRRDRHSRDVRSESRAVVGAYRRRRRQSRHRDALLVPGVGRVRRRSRNAAAARAAVDHHVQGGMELERHRSAVVRAPAQEPRPMGRAAQRRRLASRVALDADGDPSPAVRKGGRPRRQHRRRCRRAAGVRVSRVGLRRSRCPAAANWRAWRGSTSR